MTMEVSHSPVAPLSWLVGWEPTFLLRAGQIMEHGRLSDSYSEDSNEGRLECPSVVHDDIYTFLEKVLPCFREK